MKHTLKQLLRIPLAEDTINIEKIGFDENIELSTESDISSDESDLEFVTFKYLGVDLESSNLDTYLVAKILCFLFKDKNEINQVVTDTSNTILTKLSSGITKKKAQYRLLEIILQ